MSFSGVCTAYGPSSPAAQDPPKVLPVTLWYIQKKIHENAKTMPSNVPNTAMLTGTALTSVGASPRQKTREPDSAYIARAVLHVLPAACASAEAMASRKGR